MAADRTDGPVELDPAADVLQLDAERIELVAAFIEQVSCCNRHALTVSARIAG